VENTFLIALGLMLLFEGMLPLFMPQSWRETFKKLIALNDGQLRFIGLVSMSIGLLLILIFN
jgi:uncharacterized protein YjeT (DUF2065 family)